MTAPCRHTGELELGAFADGQLEGTAQLWWDEHLRGCARCREEVARVQTLGTALRASLSTIEPSSALRDAVRQIIRAPAAPAPDDPLPLQARTPDIRAAEPAAPSRRWTSWTGWRAGIAAALLIGVGFGLGRVSGPGLGEGTVMADVVDAHVRALQVDHLVDVVSTDHHVVKPWFAGKLDFSPPVPELAADGFPMLGGRTEFLAGRPVAALVYGSGPHRINLFTWPAATSGGCGEEPLAVDRGFNVVHGRIPGVEFWAVSDLNPDELRTFAAAWGRAAGAGAGCHTG
jgi:anti-sigma factor RsiW